MQLQMIYNKGSSFACLAGTWCRVQVRGGKTLRYAGTRVGFLRSLLACVGAMSAAAEGCPTAKDEIATDRPDVTNSSLFVPTGSLQSENGVNVSARDGARIFDGTNSRWRLGIAPCLEVPVDAPNYFGVYSGQGESGATDIVPAIKWQISPAPPERSTFRRRRRAGCRRAHRVSLVAGVEPYVQFPWSWAGGSGNGTESLLAFFPSEPEKPVIEQTLSLEQASRQASRRFRRVRGRLRRAWFAEPHGQHGGAYRLTRTEQIDCHAATGLNSTAPDYIVGVGYSFRVDGLF